MLNDKISVLGLPFDDVTMDEAIEQIEALIQSGSFHQIATGNINFVANSHSDPLLNKILCSCSMVLPDGMPILWTARMLGTPLKQRVCGSDLVPRLAALSAKRGYRLYLLGSDERTSSRAAAWMEAHYPGVVIAGRECPPMTTLEEMDHEGMLSRIHAARPDILLVAFGNPKQEKWIHMHRHRLHVPLAIGIGGSLAFMSGDVPRAPEWMRTSGLEWVFRVIKEPRRLLRRYMNDGLAVLRALPGEILAHALQPPVRAESSVAVSTSRGVRVISVRGHLRGGVADQFRREALAAARQRLSVVVDMQNLMNAGPEGIGALQDARRALIAAGRQMWLTGVQPATARLLRSTNVADLFLVVEAPAGAGKAIVELPAARNATEGRARKVRFSDGITWSATGHRRSAPFQAGRRAYRGRMTHSGMEPPIPADIPPGASTIAQ